MQSWEFACMVAFFFIVTYRLPVRFGCPEESVTRLTGLFSSYFDANSLLIHVRALPLHGNDTLMRPIYIWQYPTWPAFTWDDSALISLLADVRNLEGKIQGMMGSLGFDVQSKASLDVMTEDIVRSSEIEGVILNSDRVRSSIAEHLGVETVGLPRPDHYTEGIVQVMLDAVRNSCQPLNHERLFNWHAAIFPMGRSGMYPITVGAYRTGSEPMQVVSGAMGKERVHYEAPPSDAVPGMMDEFLDWVNRDGDAMDPILKAAVAHLWFVAIHPFDDGNGRLTRTITDMLLARADGFPLRFYSMSAEILRERKSYYEALERTTQGSTEITGWLMWFLQTIRKALLHAEMTIRKVVCKAQFWQRHKDILMNERQVKMVNLLWEGFEGKLTTSKWAEITKASQATALRDITDLIAKGILISAEDGGRSTNYRLNPSLM